MKKLTIVIPTYNRSSFLNTLLEKLVAEISHNDLPIYIIVSDNCSTDNSRQVIEDYVCKYEYIHPIYHGSNIGAESNFFHAVKYITTDYFWIIGDDDFPRLGVLSMVYRLINESNPDLIYLPSLWSPDAIERFLPPISSNKYTHIGVDNLSKLVHVWTTYVSGWVINRSSLMKSSFTFDDSYLTIGSNLISLSWLLPLFSAHSKCIKVDEPAIFATSSNTGGYALINTFAVNYPQLVRRYVSSRQIKFNLINGLCLKYLPRLLVMRHSNAYQNMLTDRMKYALIIRSLCISPCFWLICLPLMLIPRFILQVLSQIFSKIKS